MKFTPLFIASLFLVTQANASSEQDKINQQIMSTPGKGTIERLALHLTAEPFLLNLAQQPSEQMGMLLSRQYFHGSQSTVYSNGKQSKMKTGDIMVFTTNIPHEFHFTKASINIDFFAPARQDWIDGTADYIKNR
ncbi:hypothetical protein [Pseudocolwellia agarivorans]|uniref:hypothetical protein n=1 Tax=Pseudocolwellia agarivorans TaxID=1911682 RepID=UPI0009846F98|nr:hypothetical protein [Pseudocolwellia agarivorans]